MGENDWTAWIGRQQTTTDLITATHVAAWHATLDHAATMPAEGDAAPLGFHWTLAPALARESQLGADGHARRDGGGFLPPIPRERRLWAGSRVTFHGPLRVGERVERHSTITSIEEKMGRSAPLTFVTVRHRYTGAAGLAVEEEQDLVYRDASLGDRAGGGLATIPSSDETAAWERRIDPSETFLFRYSALTFNSHRIHYDRRYAVEVEGYAGLVVHGPLIATLLLGLIEAERPAASVERFSFRAIRLTFDTSDFVIRGRPGTTDGHFILWSMNNRGERAVEAEAWTR